VFVLFIDVIFVINSDSDLLYFSMFLYMVSVYESVPISGLIFLNPILLFSEKTRTHHTMDHIDIINSMNESGRLNPGSR